jgi:methyl-accepting chemotaxis protein
LRRRRRIILLAVATSSLVLVSFLVPLALVLRALAADRAVSTATVQAQWMAPLAATLRAGSLRLAVDQVNAENKGTPVTVFLPDGSEVGAPVRRSAEVNAAVQLAAKGRSFTSDAPGGVEVMVAVQGLPGGTAVIRTFVPEAELHRGVTRAWLLLGLVGLGLLVLSVAVADQLARSVVRPLRAVASVSDRLATGDLSARAELTGPPEVRRAGRGSTGWRRASATCWRTSGRPSPTCRTGCAPADGAADRRRVAAQPRRADATAG